MPKQLRLQLLVDNESPADLLSEHGFSAWIEAGERRLLFDTGQGTALMHNAERLGIDLSCADTLLLSHGHYDHTGGVPAFLAVNRSATVISGRDLAARRYSCHPGQAVRYIGINENTQRALAELPASRRVEPESAFQLTPGIGIGAAIPRLSPFEDSGGPFFLDPEQRQADHISDELVLWLASEAGLVIVTGCCHAGLVNTINYVRRISGIERIHALVGGLHLLHADARRLDPTLEFLASCAPDFVIPCHCTGAQAIDRLRNQPGLPRVIAGRAGQTYTFAALA